MFDSYLRNQDSIRLTYEYAGVLTLDALSSDAPVSEAQQCELLLLLRAISDSPAGVRRAFSELSRCSDLGKAGQGHERQPLGEQK